jgi:hypothetical protein
MEIMHIELLVHAKKYFKHLISINSFKPQNGARG